ncbi:hypothetical protein ACWGJP_01675 [Microbacterium sp. NPDC055903]
MRRILAIVVVLALLAAGFGAAMLIGDALGIRTEAAERMGGASDQAPDVGPAVAPPAIEVRGAPQTPMMDAAAEELDAAFAAIRTEGTATVTLAVGTGDETDDAYTLTGTADEIRIEAVSETGAARALYDIAAAAREGRDIRADAGETVRSRLGLRMADLGAVGVAADPDEWRAGTDYSHASKAFADVFLPDAPYIDAAALGAAFDDYDAYLRRIVADGYNALAFPGFVEFVAFTGVEGVYAEGDDHIDKALALREAFTPFWDRAQELGVKVFLRTDMLTLTTPLEQYLTERFGSLDTTDPELWEVYAAGLDELYEAAPALDGVLVRIGEAGRVYDVEGWDYYSSLAVTTVDAVRAMLTALTTQAEESGREVIFRSWSVGVGAVGDMHTDAQSYEEVLSGIGSPSLIVSTKYTLGDFYSWLPLNDTLLQGEQRRIVEFQSRREFEASGAFPNDLGAEYAWAINTLLAGNPRIEGIWAWAQDGGPWRAGPMILYGKAGFWQLAALNSELAMRLARDPETDPAEVTVGWAREWFSSDPATVSAIVEAMGLSRTAIEQGMYIQPYAERRVFAIGLEPPPMMWIFEWDIPTGDSAALDVIYAIVRDDLDEAIAGAALASDAAAEMADLIEQTDPETWHDPALREAFTGAIAYERDVLDLLGAYRTMFLHQAQWHDTLSAEAYGAWQAARDAFSARAEAHLAAYEGDVAHPALNLEAASLGIARADRDLAMAWFARVLLVLGAGWLVIGALAARTRLVRRPGAAAARATWTGAVLPWRADEATLGMLRTDRLLVLIVPAGLLTATRLVQTSFLSWTHPLITLGAWALFVGVLLAVLRGRAAWAVLCTLGGIIVLRCVLTLAALAFTGPGGYWFAFWTDPVRRAAYITVALALFLWTFVAVAWSLAGRWGRRRASGLVLAAAGAGLAVPAAAVAVVGLEAALTAWNDELGVLPWGLSRILGITVYLDVPADAAWAAAAAGAVLFAVGLALAVPWRRRSAVSVPPPRLERP